MEGPTIKLPPPAKSFPQFFLGFVSDKGLKVGVVPLMFRHLPARGRRTRETEGTGKGRVWRVGGDARFCWERGVCF